MSKVIQFSEIAWDTDGEKVDLPETVTAVVDDDFDPDTEGADLLSDKYGWCINSLDFREVESDYEVRNEGTVLIFYAKTERARNFRDTDLDIQPYQRWPGNAFVVDHRVGQDLIRALEDEGFIVVPLN